MVISYEFKDEYMGQIKCAGCMMSICFERLEKTLKKIGLPTKK